MKNFEKLKENLKIEDLFYKNGEVVKWTDFMCTAIKELKQEKNCYGRSCIDCYEWLKQEYKEPILDDKEPILDDVEREYLSAVIKPFRNKIIYIKKERIEREFIKIVLINDKLSLPYFKAGTMYKGMELFKRYTLKELGL